MQMSDFSQGAVWSIRARELDSMLSDLTRAEQSFESIRFTDKPESADDFMLRNGVAVIPLAGPLSKRRTFFSFFFGGTSTAWFSQVFRAALADPDVEAVVLDIDSPGGTVSGTEAAAAMVFDARAVKPVVAFGNGLMASAAYWIGSAASRVMVEKTADVGSIGVVMVHTEFSRMNEMDGIRRTVMTAGRYKAVGNSAEPLTEEGRKIIQAELDTVYDLFTQDVARNRGVDIDTVRAEMADGRVFIGQQAVDAGLADAVGGIDDAVDLALSLVPDNAGIYSTGARTPQRQGVLIMAKETDSSPAPLTITTVDELRAALPDLSQQLFDQGVASVDMAAIRTAESDRILGLVDVHFGAEAGEKFKKVVDTGVTREQYSAITGGNPPAASQEAADIDAAAASALHALKKIGQGSPGAGGGGDEKDFMALVEETMAARKIGKTAAMQIVAKTYPKLHQAFVKKANWKGED